MLLMLVPLAAAGCALRPHHTGEMPTGVQAPDISRDAFDSGVDHFEAVAERLPFADRSFDLCITLNAIDVCRNPRRAVQEFWRVLDTPGYLVIGVNTYPVASRALRV